MVSDRNIRLSPCIDYYVAHPDTPQVVELRGSWDECEDYLSQNPGLKIYFETPDIHLFTSKMRH